MKKKIVVLLFFAAIIYSCTQSLYMPVVSDAVRQEHLMQGRKLYVDRCSGCHNLHFPNEYTEQQWKMQLEEMQVKAKITDEQKELILDYLTSQPSHGK